MCVQLLCVRERQSLEWIAMAEKSSSEMQEQELDYCTSSSDDSDIMINALDLCEEVLEEEGVAELILVSKKGEG